MDKNITIGLDVGNYDTKTQNTDTPSGFSVYNELPYGTSTYILWNGKYYIPSEHRFSYVKDKTENENAFILSLFGISAEILNEAKRVNNIKENALKKDEKKNSVIGIQGEIATVNSVNLGIGLPPTHCSILGKKTVEYYEENFKDGISYIYNGYQFSYGLNFVKYYPQDFAAVLTYAPQDREDSAISFPTYYAVDIGGWTVDVVTIINNRVTMEMCDSKPLGILAMYDKIIRDVELSCGKRLDTIEVECILQGRKTLLKDDVKKEVKRGAEEWYKKIMNELRQFGVDLESSPVIFMGGGSLVFKDFIEHDPDIVKYEFIDNPHANAKGYEILVNKEIKKA